MGGSIEPLATVGLSLLLSAPLSLDELLLAQSLAAPAPTGRPQVGTARRPRVGIGLDRVWILCGRPRLVGLRRARHWRPLDRLPTCLLYTSDAADE